MDFASLYPSIIKTKNISYESIRCPHLECQSNKIPFTEHWACTKKSGIAAIMIGSLKELRVEHFKPLLRKAIEEGNKDDEEKYDMITQALKVYLNASYGVIGAETFDLYYLPTAESVTAVGRDIIINTAKYSKDIGMEVLYGDTDSLFFKNPTKEQIKKLIKFSEVTYAIDLEVDKEYRYLVLSDRKKNYFGVKTNGKIDIKGLTGKKSHTPPFLKKLFNEILAELQTIEKVEQFTLIKYKIKTMIKNTIDKFDEIPLEELAFSVQINKEPREYDGKPQVIKAAEQLTEKPVIGMHVQYVKTWTAPHVKPTILVKRSEVDKPKYIEAIERTLEQVTDPMDIDFDVILGKGKKTKMEDFF
jgi:DNA polymerase I